MTLTKMADSRANRQKTSSPKQLKPAPTVTLHPYLELDVYFVEGADGPREVLEAAFRIELAPRQLVTQGKLHPWEVPMGFLLTEFTAGRVGFGGKASRKQTELLRHQRGELDLLALSYLAEPGQERPGTPTATLRWHREKPDPLARYRDTWQRYYRAVELAGYRGPILNEPPSDLRAEFARVQHLELNLYETQRRWREHGLRGAAGDVPLYFIQAESVYDAAKAEVWWCIEHHYLARRCKECSGWFIPSGKRAWLQRYCPLHRVEGSAARHRARRRSQGSNRGLSEGVGPPRRSPTGRP